MAGPPALSMGSALRLDLIERHLRRLNPTSVVEVGCGLGAVGYRLASRYEYRGYEPDGLSFAMAARRIAELGRGEVRNTRLPSEADRRFSVLAAFEVLEHIADDFEALRLWTSWVEPGGHLLISVPAHQRRFGPQDEAVGHYRRYSRSSLEALMADAGLVDCSIESWGMPVGYVLEWARNRIARWAPTEPDRAARTSASGRSLQPPPWLGRMVEIGMWPFARIQAAFTETDRGIGFVAVGRVD